MNYLPREGHLYRFALHRIDFPLVKLPLAAEHDREYAMDELVKFLDTGRRLDERWIDEQQSIDASFRLQMELGEALQLHALHVEYQPQFEIGSGRGCGVEALARWARYSGENVPPSVFIRLAERSGLIRSLGEWVLRSACATASAWCGTAAQPTTLSVNVSALQIDEEFCSVIEQTLGRSGFPAKRLELEITESALIAHPERTIEHLKAWKQLGVRIAIDDFGTGYSSLSYLSRLPADRLKLDRSLVHRMTLDRKSAAIMRLIVALGAELDMEVIAEGVETEEQLQMLQDLGCRYAQGYLLGRPMAAERVQAALSSAWGDRPMLRSGLTADFRESRRVDRGAALSGRFAMSPRPHLLSAEPAVRRSKHVNARIPVSSIR
jgi:EAL domain-containing protein (putative c-di-GMP-specific phosphodiesterase class I)